MDAEARLIREHTSTHMTGQDTTIFLQVFMVSLHVPLQDLLRLEVKTTVFALVGAHNSQQSAVSSQASDKSQQSVVSILAKSLSTAARPYRPSHPPHFQDLYLINCSLIWSFFTLETFITRKLMAMNYFKHPVSPRNDHLSQKCDLFMGCTF